MARVVGIDPGTLSFDLCGLEEGRVFLDRTITSPAIAANPRTLVDALDSVRPLDLVIGPSGYGLPWIRLEAFSEADLFLFALADEREQGQDSGIGGMHRLVAALRETDLPVLFMPGVIHLPTVPAYRKANKIDMGTADKLRCAAVGIVDQARRRGLNYDQTGFIYVEVGGAFTAVLAVQNGQVVDGLGGSGGGPGFYASGTLDGELAYLLGKFPKATLFSGGVVYMAGRPTMSLDEAIVREEAKPAWDALYEGVVKSVAAELTVTPAAREILLSGRLCRYPAIRQELTARLSQFRPVRRVEGIAEQAKEAAQGAAIIAAGLLGGKYAGLVETMRLKEARGTVLDYIQVSGADALRQKYLSD